MSLTKQTIVNSAWQSYTVAFQAVAQLAVTAVLARLLSPADFGLVAIANVAIGFAGMFARFGFGQAIVQRKDLTQRHIQVAFSASLLMAALLMSALMLVAPVVAQFFRNEAVVGVLRALSLSFLFANLGIVAEFLLLRDLAFKKLFWVTVVTYTFGYALIGIGLALLGFGVWSLVGATLATNLLRSLVLVGVRPHPKRFSLARQELNELAQYGGGFTAFALAKYVANNGDYFVIGRWLGAAALGVYQQAFNILVVFAKYLGDILDRVLFATASRIQEQPDKVTRGYVRALSLINLCLLPLSTVMIVLAPEIVTIYLGSKWGDAILPAQILLVGLTLRSQSRISDAFIQAMGVVYRSAARKGIFAIAVVLGSLFALPWGIAGVAAAVTLATLLDYLLVLTLGLRVTGTDWREYTANQLPGAFVSAVALLVCLPTANLLRALLLGPLAVATSSILVTFLAVSGIIWLFPRTLGSTGKWFLDQVFGMLSQSWVFRCRSIWLKK